jgi:hypothetical protein
MRLAIGLILLALGIAGAVIAFVLNSSTPMQLGPIPFFGGCFVALVGLIVVITALVG